MASVPQPQSGNASAGDPVVDANSSTDDDDDLVVLEVIRPNDASNNNGGPGAEDALDDKREKLTKWIQERKVVEEGLRLEIRERGRRIASLTTGTKELESTLKQLREELQSLETRLRNEKSEREKLDKDRDAELKKTREELETESTRLKAHLDGLKTELEMAKETRVKLEGNIFAVRAGSMQLQEEKVELTRKLGEKENEITRLTIEQGRIEREALDATVTLNKEVSSLKEKLKAKEDEVEQLGKQLKKEQEKGNTERMLKKIEELKDQLRKKKDDLYEAQKDLKAEREAPKSPPAFQAKEERLNMLVKEKDNELNKMSYEKSKMEKELRDEVSALHREMAGLKEQLAVAQVPAPAAPTGRLAPPPPPTHAPDAQLQTLPPLPNAAALLRALQAVPPPPPPPSKPAETAANEPRKRRSAEPMQAMENLQPAGAAQTTTPSPPGTGARNLKDLSAGWKKFRPDLTFVAPPTENLPPANPAPTGQHHPETSPSSTASPPGSPDANPAKLLIRNLHPKVTSEMLTKIVGPFGELRCVEVAMKNGESRGYAHVEYVNIKDAMTALRMLAVGIQLLDRKLVVSGAKGNRLS